MKTVKISCGRTRKVFLFSSIELIHPMNQRLLTHLFQLIVLIFVQDNCAFSQKLVPEPNYQIFGENRGLPSTETYKVIQDKSGYIWMLTDRGVVRFDGYRTKTFTTDDGLQDNVNFDCVEDSKGRIWFVGFNGKLTIFEKGKMYNYKYNVKIKRVFNFSRIPLLNLITLPQGGIILIYQGLLQFQKQDK